MADAAVEFLLDNLQQLLLYHTHLISDAKNQVEKLERDLRLFKAFLRDSTKKRRKDEKLREVVRQIRDVVYEAEDVIDAFVTQAAETKTKKYFGWLSSPVKLHGIAEQVNLVGSKVQEIYGGKDRIDFAALQIGDGGTEEIEPPQLKQDQNIVGFEDEADKLIGYLKEETNQLDAVSIIGMPGLGKTTLAWKIFHDPRIQYEFPTRIWVYISQEFTKKKVFLSILNEFTRVTDDMRDKSDQELARIVSAHLQSGKFLIVMDDVWTAEDWDALKIALPNSNGMGKVLITSRHREVGCYANRIRAPHNLRFLTPEESWQLFQYEVFGKLECPPELEVVGKLITEQCNKLPLAIVVIGGVLAKKFSSTTDKGARENAWRKVSQSVSTYLTTEDPTGRMENIIALSYDKLPFHLRACFLYFGMFPEDFEIPVWKLVRMWIAEGFIQQKEGLSLEEIAESYLDELISRNLVRVDKIRRDGRVKSCRIHDMLRDFCRREAGDSRENFLQEVKRTSEGFVPSIVKIKDVRRLCIHSSVLNFFSCKPHGPHVRSFVCFSNEEINLPTESISAIPTAFKLLRVLEGKPIKFSKIPSDFYQLVHLRYITISFNLPILPPALSKLWNMQTLVVDTSSRTLEIKADIWSMTHLRHFKTNASATLPKAGKGSKSTKEGEKLQTLGTISPQSCKDEIFDRARNLKKLGIRGLLVVLLEGKNSSNSFDSLGKLVNLEKLKLLNDVFPAPPSDGQLRNLPQPYQFPPKLRSLTLADTFLDWSQMSILGLLENLEVLKLKDKAFMGRSWESVSGGFRRLGVLHIGRTDLTIWTASAHHFPRLRSLELLNCEELQEVPSALADVPTFQMLYLFRTTQAAKSAKRIRDIKLRKIQEENTDKANGFKLSIFPPDE